MTDDDRHRLGHNEARTRILAAAARVYNRRGERTTVEEIAEEADYSTSALYKHFSNKDEILHSLWRAVKEEVLNVLQSEPPMELGFVGRLKWLLFEFADMAEQEEQLFIASMANAPSPIRHDTLDDSVAETYEQFRATIRTIMQQGLDEGVLDSRFDADFYGLALAGQMQALVERWTVDGSVPLRPRLEEMLGLFLRGAADPEADLDALET